tara:strand:- start:14546 stop:15409 length:864 start_codon:yes stop_codon:yes gene_type:complete
MAVVGIKPTRKDKIALALEEYLGIDPRKSYRTLNKLEGVASLIPGVSAMTLSPDASLGDQVLAGFEFIPGAAPMSKAGKFVLNEAKPMLHGSLNQGITKLTKQVEGMPNVLNPSMQRGGVYLTDDFTDAAAYANKGKKFGKVYTVDVNPKGMYDAENLPFGIATMLKGMAPGKNARLESVTPSQFQARDILNFMENPNKLYFPKNFDPQISDALQKKGVGSLIFNMTKGTGVDYPIQRMIVLNDDLMKIRKSTGKIDDKVIDEVAERIDPYKLEQNLKRLRKYFSDD